VRHRPSRSLPAAIGDAPAHHPGEKILCAPVPVGWASMAQQKMKRLAARLVAMVAEPSPLFGRYGSREIGLKSILVK